MKHSNTSQYSNAERMPNAADFSNNKKRKTIGIPVTICILAACFLAIYVSADADLFSYGKKIKPLDYAKSSNWVIADYREDSAYDIVYFYGTGVQEPTQGNGVGDVSGEMKAAAIHNYKKVGEQLSECGPKGNRKAGVFIPAYRQIALSYTLSKFDDHKDLLNNIHSKEPSADLAAALDYYFKFYNERGRKPFVLVGHSQGAAALQVMLDDYFINGRHKAELRNMIAAYSIGYGVSEKWFDGLDKTLYGETVLHFAKGSSDFNCLISWNTEGPGEKGKNRLLADEGDRTLVINPLNWKTDETYAGTELNKGVLVRNDANNATDDTAGRSGDADSNAISEFRISHDEFDLFDAQIDSERGSVICTLNTNYATMPGIDDLWGGKSLHYYDGTGFYENMKSNLKKRLAFFLCET